MNIFTAIKLNKIQDVKKYVADGNPLNIENENGMPLIVYAAYFKRREILKLLAYEGADPDLKDRNGHSAATCAAMNEMSLEPLIDVRANLDNKDKDGLTPLLWAADRDSFGTVKLLIQHGANPYIENDRGENLLDYAQYLAHHLGYYKLFKQIKKLLKVKKYKKAPKESKFSKDFSKL